MSNTPDACGYGACGDRACAEVAALAGIDAGSLDPVDAVEFTVAAERLASWCDWLRGRGLVAVASPERVVEEYVVVGARTDAERRVVIEDAAPEEVASALRWSPSAAHDRIGSARLLAGPLAGTSAALAAGEISPAHVRAIVEAARRLSGGPEDHDVDGANDGRELGLSAAGGTVGA